MVTGDCGEEHLKLMFQLTATT